MCGRMEPLGFTLNLAIESIEFCEEPIGQTRAAFLFVILQDRTQIFLDESMKDQRHRLSAQRFLQRWPLDASRRVRFQFHIPAQRFGDSFIGVR